MLVTDIVMPGGSGRELYERLAAMRPDLKAVFVSGYAPQEAAGEGRGGALPEGTEFLQKPFSIENLARKVNRVLKDSRGKRAA